MKNLLLCLIALLIFNISSLAQAPEKFKYQAIITDNKDHPVRNKTIGLEISILQSNLNGIIVYQETFTTRTSNAGLVNLEIGTGMITSGVFSDINWGIGPYYLGIGVDMNGSGNYISMGASQLLSVPYALYAKQAQSVDGDNDTDPTNEIELPETANENDVLTFDGSEWVAMENTDTDPTNEVQQLSITDNQLTISNGNTVDLPASSNGSVPVFTSAEIQGLTPGIGDAVFNNTEKLFQVYDGTSWQVFNSNCWPEPTIADAGDDEIFTDGTTTVTLAANTPEEGYGTGEWTITSGEGGSFDDPNSPTATFSGIECENYTLRWSISTACGRSSDALSIEFTEVVTVADAGPSQITHYDLTTTTTLGATIPAENEAGEWTILSGEGGSFDDPSSPTAKFTGELCASYYLRWTISNGCSSSSDDVSIRSFPDVTEANAGWDQLINDGSTTTTLNANTPEAAHETGQWTVQQGNGGSFSDPTSPTATFTGNQCKTYLLKWSISCGNNSVDYVRIEFTLDLPVADAGEDQVITGGITTAALAANIPEGYETGAWTVLSGEGGSFDDPTSPTTGFNGLIQESYTLKWKISTECNFDSDEVKIAFWQDNFEVTDAGGNTYKTVVIGNQIWMAENLAYLPTVSPSTNGSTTVPFSYVYDYNGSDISAAKATENYNTYGVMYNWPAAQQSCPDGWHIPTVYEWQALANFVSEQMGPYDPYGFNWPNVGGHLKATTGWDSSNGTDDFDFSALPGGLRESQGIFSGIGVRAAWWTSSNRLGGVNDKYITNSNLNTNLSQPLEKGYYVRCVKD